MDTCIDMMIIDWGYKTKPQARRDVFVQTECINFMVLLAFNFKTCYIISNNQDWSKFHSDILL